MQGFIELEGMEFFAYHGCHEAEQLVGNKFLVHVRLYTDCSAAATSDDIRDALDYLSAHEIVAREMRVTSNLLEHVARRILDALHAAFPALASATVKISKLNPPLGGKVAASSVTLST
jgi:dihydroneopterin aldolase